MSAGRVVAPQLISRRCLTQLWRQHTRGWLRSWAAAARAVAPLGRTNGQHADRLLHVLPVTPLSARELCCWFEQ